MNVLILGSGGREHALAWKIAQSRLLKKLYIAPGNAGTLHHGENIEINLLDFDSIADFCLNKSIELVVVGPEDPLVNGIADYFSSKSELSHITLIGPPKQGARLEGSKDFAKQFMLRHNIPTAAYQSFKASEFEQACAFLKILSPPYVLKADGLAAGKGVVIAEGYDEACAELRSMLIDKKFGAASESVVIEEFLKGLELSIFVLTDGKNYLLLPEAKDYKRIGEGDTGLNTGGMGTLSPVPFAGKEFMDKVRTRIILPTLSGLQNDDIDYRGFIFFGIMNVNGDPFVIEYNVRLGDPETESILPRIESDLLEAFLLIKEQKLNTFSIQISPLHAATLMMVSGGYPGNYEKGKTISGIMTVSDSLVFHAGTREDRNGNILTNGGRVIALTSLGKTLKEAFARSYLSAEKIHFDRKYYRADLGKDVM